MDQLSKHQLILVALLVSFVTSLATGIFTVSLMSQAPQGVVKTINQVVEKIVTPQAATITVAPPVVSTEDKITSAVAQVSKSIVKLRSIDSDTVVGLGLVVSKNGVIMVDKSTLAKLTGFDALFADGHHFPMSIVQSQTNGDVVFLAPSTFVSNAVASSTFLAITFGRAPKVGQTALTLSGTDSIVLSQGIISRTLLDNINADGSQPALIDTSIPGSKIVLGSPVFNLDGEVVGMNTSTVSKDSDTAAYYPVMQLKGAIPKMQ